MKRVPSRNRGDICSKSRFVCADCGRELLKDDIGEKWNKCEFCGNPICVTCSHYIGAIIEDIWKDFVSVRRVCRKCMIKL